MAGQVISATNNVEINHLSRQNVEFDPRESMKVLPGIFQVPLTWMTGKPFLGQKRWQLTPLHHLIKAIIVLTIGVIFSTIAVARGYAWLFFLFPGWILTLHGMRCLRIMIFHQCAHENLFGKKHIDTFIGNIISMVLLIQDFCDYKREHIGDHHSAYHMTMRDPTVKSLLLGIGFRVGMTRQQLWKHLLITIVSPRFHAKFIIERLRSHFLPASKSSKIASLLFVAILFTIVSVTRSWSIFLIVWLIPLTIFFNATNVVRLCVKHVFPPPGAKKGSRAYFASLTYGIFLGEPVPNPNLPFFYKVRAWLVWIMRMTFIHLPSRLLVLTGDIVCHDYHHRFPKSKDWANYIFARHADLIAGHPGWPDYKEVWTLVEAINLVFDSLTTADPLEFNVAKVEFANSYELFTELDD